jgi:UDP-4-amino-4,6-dideoxy-N-acetyl-beta-L-altrosamine N-acetyltransferase
MIISGYGIKLTRLDQSEIEMVRNWRNASHIREKMEIKELIQPEQQKEWFKTINNIDNNYFIIHANGIKVGLIYAAKIDWDKSFTGNAGIFIYEEKYQETGVPLAASFLLTDTSFLMNIKKSYITVLSNNKKAIEFNKALGYKIMPNQEGIFNQKYELDIANYETFRNLIRTKLFPKSSFESIQIQLDISNKVDQYFIKRMNEHNQEAQDNFQITIS